MMSNALKRTAWQNIREFAGFGRWTIERERLYGPYPFGEQIANIEGETFKKRWLDYRLFMILAGNYKPGSTDFFYMSLLLEQPRKHGLLLSVSEYSLLENFVSLLLDQQA